MESIKEHLNEMDIKRYFEKLPLSKLADYSECISNIIKNRVILIEAALPDKLKKSWNG